MKRALVLTACLIAGHPAWAGDRLDPVRKLDGLRTMTTTGGRCPVFRDGSAIYPSGCKAAIYAQFSNGRIAWTVPTPDGALTISGSRDQQPNPEQYMLVIDTVRRGDGQGRSVQAQARGQCTSIVSTDGAYLRTLDCNVVSDRGPVQIRFVGMTRTKIEHFN